LNRTHDEYRDRDDAGADLAALDGCFSPNSPLGYVTSWATAHIVRYLASKRSNINQHGSKHLQNQSIPYSVGGDKVTPLHMAAYTWSAAAVQAILDLGADPNATDEYGRQP
jgi:ankyrin repeat protein